MKGVEKRLVAKLTKCEMYEWSYGNLLLCKLIKQADKQMKKGA